MSHHARLLPLPRGKRPGRADVIDLDGGGGVDDGAVAADADAAAADDRAAAADVETAAADVIDIDDDDESDDDIPLNQISVQRPPVEGPAANEDDSVATADADADDVGGQLRVPSFVPGSDDDDDDDNDDVDAARGATSPPTKRQRSASPPPSRVARAGDGGGTAIAAVGASPSRGGSAPAVGAGTVVLDLDHTVIHGLDAAVFPARPALPCERTVDVRRPPPLGGGVLRVGVRCGATRLLCEVRARVVWFCLVLDSRNR